jgi:ParB-like chromosome segregation protein Spo0J
METGYTKVEIEAIELLENFRHDMGGVKEIKESIRAVGLQVPLIVQRKHSTGKRGTDGKEVNTRYFLIDGYTRLQAIRELRAEDPKAFPEILVETKKCSDNEARLLMLAVNLPRHGFSVVDTGNAIRELQNLGYKLADIAKAIGRSTSWCGTAIKMQENLAPAVLAAIAAGDVSVSAASAWVDLDIGKQMEALRNAVTAKKVGGKKAAKRQADRDGGRPDKPRQKDVKAFLDDVDLAAKNSARWAGVAEGVRYTQGMCANLVEQAEKAARAERVRQGQDKAGQQRLGVDNDGKDQTGDGDDLDDEEAAS